MKQRDLDKLVEEIVEDANRYDIDGGGGIAFNKDGNRTSYSPKKWIREDIKKRIKNFIKQIEDNAVKREREKIANSIPFLSEKFEEEMTRLTMGLAVHGMGNVHLFADELTVKIGENNYDLSQSQTKRKE